uniref:Uncharacterized protein n=1 Tax=Physcomitrium patens TaxID=3218 RepID=A0A2K1L2P9_PHYPA|nr:hypothetical protein PHYPA_003102 [Physcomitrium patens]
MQVFIQLCTDTKGIIFFSRVDKKEFVAQKYVQTLVLISAQAILLSLINVLHRNIGLVSPNDRLDLFSKSRATKELNILILYAIDKSAYLIGILFLKYSIFWKTCDMHVYLPLERELCPLILC